MAKVTEQVGLERSADAVWRSIGNFAALVDWHPGVKGLELEEGGTLRRLTLADGGQIVERLESHDDAGRSYSYSIVESPLPVADYLATLRVVDNGGRACEVEWSGEFRSEGAPETEAVQIVRGIYRAGLDALKSA